MHTIAWLTWPNAEQSAILILSALAIGMVNLGPSKRWRFWGNVAGLAVTPLILHSTYVSGQWGMLALSLVYLVIWIAGCVRHW